MTQRQLQAAARKRKALLDAPLPYVKGPFAGLPLTLIARLTQPITAHSTSYPWGGVALGDRFYGDHNKPLHKKPTEGSHDEYLSTRDFDDWPSKVLA